MSTMRRRLESVEERIVLQQHRDFMRQIQGGPRTRVLVEVHVVGVNFADTLPSSACQRQPWRRRASLGVHKAVRCRSNKVTQILGIGGNDKAATTHCGSCEIRVAHKSQAGKVGDLWLQGQNSRSASSTL